MTFQIKSFLDEQREIIKRAHKEGADSFATCAALTAMMDEVVHRNAGMAVGSFSRIPMSM